MRMKGVDFRIIVLDNGSSESPDIAVQQWAENGLATAPSHPSWRQQLSSDRIHQVTYRQIASDCTWDANVLVTLVEVGWNSGFAHANNIGIKMALEVPEVSHVWLLNNDTIVQPDTLTELKATADNDPDYAIIGSTLIYYHSNDLVQGIGARFNRFSGRTKLIGNKVGYRDLVSRFADMPKIDFVIGASMFVSRKFIKSAGLMDERYFLYFEELDWALRLRSDQKMGWSQSSIVYHKEGGSIGSNSSGKGSSLSYYYLNRGLIIFYRKWYPQLVPLALLKSLFIIVRFFSKSDFDRARAAWRGTVSGIRAILNETNGERPKSPPHLY